jgi:hypothetical protein
VKGSGRQKESLFLSQVSQREAKQRRREMLVDTDTEEKSVKVFGSQENLRQRSMKEFWDLESVCNPNIEIKY